MGKRILATAVSCWFLLACNDSESSGRLSKLPPEEHYAFQTTISLGDFLEAKSTGEASLLVRERSDGYEWTIRTGGGALAPYESGAQRFFSVNYLKRNTDPMGSVDVASHRWRDIEGVEQSVSVIYSEHHKEEHGPGEYWEAWSENWHARSGELRLEPTGDDSVRMQVSEVELEPAPWEICENTPDGATTCHEEPVAVDDPREPIAVNGEIYGKFSWRCIPLVAPGEAVPFGDEEWVKATAFCRRHAP